jgi:hypothetical protein
LKEADADDLNEHLGTDRFIFEYVRAVKNRGDQDDMQFMGVLKDSLITFKRQMQKKQEDAKAALSFALDPEDPAPLPDTSSKGETHAKKNGNNGKSKTVSIYLYFCTKILIICRKSVRNPGPHPLPSVSRPRFGP